MRCKFCGTKLKENARFCKNCGQAVEKEELPEIVLEPIQWSESKSVDTFFREIRERLELLEDEYSNQQKENLNVVRKKEGLERTLKENDVSLKKMEKEVSDLKIALEEKEQENQKLKLLLAEIENEKNENKEDETEELLVCPNCHATIDASTIFCGECGTKVR